MLLNKTEQHQEEQGQMRFMTLNNVRMYVVITLNHISNFVKSSVVEVFYT